MEEELSQREREQRAAVGHAAEVKQLVQSLEQQQQQLIAKLGTRNKRPADKEALLVISIKLKTARNKMWDQMAAAANLTSRVQDAQGALGAMHAVLQVKSKAAEALQARLFELEGHGKKFAKANRAEIDLLIDRAGELRALNDDAYRAMVEQREHDAQVLEHPQAKQLHNEISKLYQMADRTGTRELRSRYHELARLKKDKIQALEQNRTHYEELQSLEEERDTVVNELEADQNNSKAAQQAVEALQRSLQEKVAGVRKEMAVKVREPLLEKFKQNALKQDAIDAVQLLEEMSQKRLQQNVQLDMLTRPMWTQIALLHEEKASSALTDHLNAVGKVLDQITLQKSKILKPTNIVVESLMLAPHEAKAKLAQEQAASATGKRDMLTRKVQELQAAIQLERQTSDLPPETLEAALIDLTTELSENSIQLGRAEEEAWLATAKAQWLEQTQVVEFEKKGLAKQQALDSTVTQQAQELDAAARNMTESVASMWQQSTVEAVEKIANTTTSALHKAQQQLLPKDNTATEEAVHTEAPTAAPTHAPTGKFVPKESPVQWEAQLHSKDAAHIQAIKQEVEEHLHLATQVARQRGVEPPTIEDAEADAAKRAAAAAQKVATQHGNGLDPEKLPLLSRVGVPPPPEVEPPEPVMPPPPPDPIEIQAAKVEHQAKHVELLNSELANLTKAVPPNDPIEYMRYDARLDELQKSVKTETAHLMKAKEVLTELEGSKEVNDARNLMKAAKLKADAYRKQYSEYASAKPVNQFAVKRLAAKLHKAKAAFEDAKDSYAELITNNQITLKQQVRQENEVIEELETEMKETLAVGNNKLAAEQKAVITKMAKELARKKRELERLHALAKLVGAPESPPGMYYWPNAEEQRDLEKQSVQGLNDHMSENIARLQVIRKDKQTADSAPASQAPGSDDAHEKKNNQANQAQWDLVTKKLTSFFKSQLAQMMRTVRG